MDSWCTGSTGNCKWWEEKAPREREREGGRTSQGGTAGVVLFQGSRAYTEQGKHYAGRRTALKGGPVQMHLRYIRGISTFGLNFVRRKRCWKAIALPGHNTQRGLWCRSTLKTQPMGWGWGDSHSSKLWTVFYKCRYVIHSFKVRYSEICSIKWYCC